MKSLLMEIEKDKSRCATRKIMKNDRGEPKSMRYEDEILKRRRLGVRIRARD